MKLEENIMFIRLSFGLPRQTRKVQAQADVDPKRLKASAKLYSGEAFRAIQSLDADTRMELARLAIDIPACFRGTCIMPSAILDRTTTLLQDRLNQRQAKVDQFVTESYGIEREAAREALRDSFRDDDFPPAEIIKQSFRMDWSIFQLSVPEGLPVALRDAETAKFKATMADVATQCRSALREAMSDLVGHLADRLAPDAEGNRKRLCSSTVEQLREFLDTVNARDITSDDAIKDLSAKAKAIIGNYSADDLKTPLFARRVQDGLKQVKADLDTLIEREGGRKIDLDMD
jgi:hypothetical protein